MLTTHTSTRRLVRRKHNNPFQRIEACIAEIRMWLKYNKLMLKDEKTDVGLLVISTVSRRSKLQMPHLKIGSSLVTPSPVVRNIGLHMNSVMDMEQQVQNICQLCYFHIYSISKIRHLLNNCDIGSCFHYI